MSFRRGEKRFIKFREPLRGLIPVSVIKNDEKIRTVRGWLGFN